MTRDEARRRVIEELPQQYLKRDGSRKGFICPVCNSGSGQKGTGMTENKGNPHHFTCWSQNCFKNSDIIDIVQKDRGLSTYNDALEECCKLLGLDYESLESDLSSIGSSRSARPTVQRESERVDYLEQYKAYMQNMSATEYMHNRGLSDETLKRFMIGFCSAWQSPKALREGKNPPKTPRVIIPTSRYSYIARDTRVNVPEKEKSYVKMKEGNVSLFNIKAMKDIKSPAAVFVVEGEIDAMSIEEIGLHAVGIGSTSMTGKFADFCKANRPNCTLIIALDTDESGLKAGASLTEQLKQAHIPCVNVTYRTENGIESIYRKQNDDGFYGDANEMLVADRAYFEIAFRSAAEQYCNMPDDDTKAERESYEKHSASQYLGSFVSDTIAKGQDFIPTGFYEIDKTLDGGLRAGLYFIGAVSSLGKTTFLLQISDHIAAHGKDVIYISLEMSARELIARSISRHTYIRSEDKKLAKTTLGVMSGKKYQYYSDDEKNNINGAIEDYGKYADHIYIHEGVGDIGVDQIRSIVEEHIRITGQKPVVMIDYLQILGRPSDEKGGTDKQHVDFDVRELKRMSRDLDLPVVAISSFNRDSYDEPVGMTSFKESGAVEYSSDVLIGLQYYGMDYEKIEKYKTDAATGNREKYISWESDNDHRHRVALLREQNAAKSGKLEAIDIQVKVLKNRNGQRNENIKVQLVQAFNCFSEDDGKFVSAEGEEIPFDNLDQSEDYEQIDLATVSNDFIAD